MTLMQQTYGPALLRTHAPRTYVALRRLLHGVTPRRTWSGRRQRLAEHVGAYPSRSTDKLRFADIDCNGHISYAVFAICCQNARMEVQSDPNRAPVPDGAHFIIARLQLDLLAEMHWPGIVEIGTRFAHIGRSSIVFMQDVFLKGRCVARAKSIVVLIAAATRRATPLPPIHHNRFSVNFHLGNAIKGILVRL